MSAAEKRCVIFSFVATFAAALSDATHQTEAVSEGREVEGDVEVLAPEVVRNVRGQVEGAEDGERLVELPLELHHRVRLDVRQRHRLALAQHLGVLPTEQPAHVGEEEAPRGVVRVGVGVAELVVHSVVARPLENVVLQRGRVEYHEEDAQRQLRLVRSV